MEHCKQGTPEDVQNCFVMANTTVVEQPTVYSNLTAGLTRFSVDFIAANAARAKPFFLVMSYVHVHTPLFSAPKNRNVSGDGRFGDNVVEMDESVGTILAALDTHGVANNTLVFFTSDNGPYAEEGWDRCGRTGGLKGSKGQTWEGGIRVPGIVRWPGVAPAGTVSDAPVSTLDIFPTALAAAGVPLPSDRIIDGRDMAPLLRAPATAGTQHEWLWHYCGHNVTAARNARYKFHFRTQKWGTDERPSPKCHQCCPYSPYAFNGTGGSLCNCGEHDTVMHDPPLVFDMRVDREEMYPLGPDTLANFSQEVAEAKLALAQHYAHMKPAKDQMVSLPIAPLNPCCDGTWPKGPCRCERYQPGVIYP